jgi:hypothetical protein
MAELKTKPTKQTVSQFVKSLKDVQIRKDCEVLTRIMQKVTGDTGKMWGSAIAGFGTLHLTYASGRELDWFSVGFSPRKKALTLYLLMGYENKKALLKKLGTHSIGKSCLYIHKLSEVDMRVLRELITLSYKESKKRYGTVKS